MSTTGIDRAALLDKYPSEREKRLRAGGNEQYVEVTGTFAHALKPWYRQLCKRPCFQDEYLQSFNHPDVHLVDTDGKGVERIDATGIWANGEHVELDCIIYASEVGTDVARRSGFDAVGRDGVRLSHQWADGGWGRPTHERGFIRSRTGNVLVMSSRMSC